MCVFGVKSITNSVHGFLKCVLQNHLVALLVKYGSELIYCFDERMKMLHNRLKSFLSLTVICSRRYECGLLAFMTKGQSHGEIIEIKNGNKKLPKFPK